MLDFILIVSLSCIIVGTMVYFSGMFTKEAEDREAEWGIAGFFFVLGVVGGLISGYHVVTERQEKDLVTFGIAEYYLDENNERQFRVLPEYQERYDAAKKAKEKK